MHEDVGEVRADLEGGRVEVEHTIELRVVPPDVRQGFVWSWVRGVALRAGVEVDNAQMALELGAEGGRQECEDADLALAVAQGLVFVAFHVE